MYHCLYYIDRERTFTTTTLRTLAARRIKILDEPVLFLQVNLKDGCAWTGAFIDTLKAYYDCLRQGLPATIGLQGCEELLKIRDVLSFTLIPPSANDSWIPGRLVCSRPCFKAAIIAVDEFLSSGDSYIHTDAAVHSELFPRGWNNYFAVSLSPGSGHERVLELRFTTDENDQLQCITLHIET